MEGKCHIPHLEGAAADPATEAGLGDAAQVLAPGRLHVRTQSSPAGNSTQHSALRARNAGRASFPQHRPRSAHLFLHQGSPLGAPAVVRVVRDGRGTAKVTQLNGPLITKQQVLNL